MAGDIKLRTLWVGNLDSGVTEELLWELFINAGPIDSIVRPCTNEKVPKTFAFVEFSDVCAVPFAYDLLSGTEMFGRRLRLQNQETGLGIRGGSETYDSLVRDDPRCKLTTKMAESHRSYRRSSRRTDSSSYRDEHRSAQHHRHINDDNRDTRRSYHYQHDDRSAEYQHHYQHYQSSDYGSSSYGRSHPSYGMSNMNWHQPNTSSDCYDASYRNESHSAQRYQYDDYSDMAGRGGHYGADLRDSLGGSHGRAESGGVCRDYHHRGGRYNPYHQGGYNQYPDAYYNGYEMSSSRDGQYYDTYSGRSGQQSMSSSQYGCYERSPTTRSHDQYQQDLRTVMQDIRERGKLNSARR